VSALKAAADKGDFGELLGALGLPLWLVPAIEVVIAVLELALVYFGVKLLPPEWFGFLPADVRSFLQIGVSPQYSSARLLDQHHFSIWIPVPALKADFKEMHRRRPGLGLAVTLLLVYLAGFLSTPFVNVSSDASSSLARRAAEKRPPPRDMETSLSPEDSYEMPRTPEEEKKMNYWKSDFDDLSAEEKLKSPLVVLGFFLFLTPFIGGFYLLVSGGGLDD
ncbi:unnamed protein product, partial [Symbiodinium necroappetens]